MIKKKLIVPMLDIKEINARIEPGAIIRDKVQIGNKKGRNEIMMKVCYQYWCLHWWEETMIDMGAILGG